MKKTQRGKALAGVCVTLAIALGAIGYTQIRSAPPKDILSRTKLPTPMELLTGRVEDLEKENAKLKSDLKALRDDFVKTSETLQAALRPPKGYTTMLITKSNFNNVEGTALMKFWVRY